VLSASLNHEGNASRGIETPDLPAPEGNRFDLFSRDFPSLSGFASPLSIPMGGRPDSHPLSEWDGSSPAGSSRVDRSACSLRAIALAPSSECRAGLASAVGGPALNIRGCALWIVDPFRILTRSPASEECDFLGSSRAVGF
jgi:hypothetical protein